MAAFLQTHEPEHRALNSLPTCQKSMVLEKCSFLLAQSGSDSDPFVFGENDASEGGVQSDVVVESAGILRDRVDVATECTEGAAIDGVRVCDAVYFGTGCVDCMMDHVCWRKRKVNRQNLGLGRNKHTRCIQKTDRSAIDNLAILIDENQIRSFQKWPCDSKRIDPETCGFDGILGDTSISPHSCQHSIFSSQLDMISTTTEPQKRLESEKGGLTLKVICPATPSSNPSFAKILNASASLPF